MSIKLAMQARIQNWESTHFETTKYGKKMRKYKGLHLGEKCFVIGNGPSLSAEDLDILYEHNVVTFATNRVFNIFDRTAWRPTYYASEDIIILRDIQSIISDMNVKARFIPVNLKWYEDVDIKNADYFYMDYNNDYRKTFGISTDIPHGIRCRGTVTMTCLQLAIYMGFSEIYLLGIDHNFAKMINMDGKLVIDNSIKNHFSEKYDAGVKDQGYDIGNTTKAYLDVENFSRETNSFRVFNATRGGKLEVYERVNFDDLF